MLLQNAFALLNRILPAENAYAHCDIPCGIYDPHLMQLSALTCVRMNQLINDLAPPGSMEKADRDKYMHALVRYTQVKEEHAEIVKREARIIRGDFFKPDNSPENLGELTDGIMKTASKARQNLDIDAANELLTSRNSSPKPSGRPKASRPSASPPTRPPAANTSSPPTKDEAPQERPTVGGRAVDALIPVSIR